MTRPLHEQTRVQRGERDDLPQSAVERGYEAADAPPARVAMGVAAFVAVMFIGLGAAGLLVEVWGKQHHPSTGAATQGSHQPPPPRLLANPQAQRRRIEAAAADRLQQGAEPIGRAMADVARSGWGDEAATSPAAQAAGHPTETAR